MKYLQDYIEEEQSKLLEDFGVFFAFNDEQFKEGAEQNKHLKPEGTKWASLGAGMYMPSVLVDAFNDAHKLCVEKGVQKDLAENGREAILERELGNYEIGLAWDGYNDPNFRSAIKDYGFTEEEIKQAYSNHMANAEY